MTQSEIRENEEYYNCLFDLQESGRANSWRVVFYLQNEMGLDKHKARKVLLSWIDNYEEIAAELKATI